MCGKNGIICPYSLGDEGSPPRVREEPEMDARIKEYIGITPACAGRTKFVAKYEKIYEDHPRVCGKN